MALVGQIVLLSLKSYPDGTAVSYAKRPYLIVELSDTQAGILIISSTAGKESKLLYKSNFDLECSPPLAKPSFVKLDTLQHILLSELDAGTIIGNGQCLPSEKMDYILSKLQTMYSQATLKPARYL